jgi:hypothetical protein
MNWKGFERIKDSPSIFMKELGKNTRIRIAEGLAEMGIEHLPNTCPELYRSVTLSYKCLKTGEEDERASAV